MARIDIGVEAVSKGKPRRAFGSIRRLKSGRWQARYPGPDGKTVNGPHTFAQKFHAEAWLVDRKREADLALWNPAAIKPERVLFGEYARTWLLERRSAGRPLKPRTRDHYQRIVNLYLLPEFGDRELASITSQQVRQWYVALLPDKPTYRAHVYGLLHAIMKTAFSDELIAADPCRLRGAGQAQRVHQIVVATIPEIDAATAAMPEHLRLAVSLSVWTHVRFGDLTELRRKDADVEAQVIHVRRGVVRLASGQFHVGTPKSKAGIRTISMPPHVVEQVERHLDNYVPAEPDSLLLPARLDAPQQHMTQNWLHYRWKLARKAAGREDLTWHDLRHTGLTMAARTGATTAELMARAGHSSPGAAMRYQHATRARDQEIAAQLSKQAENG
jgi:integrase